MDSVRENIDHLRQLMEMENDMRVREVNEGFMDRLKNTAAGVTGGIKGAIKSVGQGAMNGAKLSKVDALYGRAKSVFEKMKSVIDDNMDLFNTLEDYRKQLNRLNVDDATKRKYEALIANIQQKKNDAYKLISKDVSNSPAPRPTTAATTPTPSQDYPQTGAKVFDINSLLAQRQIDTFLKMRKTANESQILDEAQVEGKFHEVFRLLFMNADRMAHSIATDMDGDSIATIMKLAFKTILDKGQSSFVNDVKEINNGYNAYRSAHKNLKNKPATQEPEAQAPAQQDRTEEAKTLAQQFLVKYQYEDTPENIDAATQYILNSKDF
jgi:hypothetical protein